MYRESPSSQVLVLYRRCRSSPSVPSPSSPTKFAPSGLTRGTMVIVRLSRIVPPGAARRQPVEDLHDGLRARGLVPVDLVDEVEALVAVADRNLPDRVPSTGRFADLVQFDAVAASVDLLESLAQLLVVEVRLVVDRALVRRPRTTRAVVAARLSAHRGSEPREADRCDTALKEASPVHVRSTRPDVV